MRFLIPRLLLQSLETGLRIAMGPALSDVANMIAASVGAEF